MSLREHRVWISGQDSSYIRTPLFQIDFWGWDQIISWDPDRYRLGRMAAFGRRPHSVFARFPRSHKTSNWGKRSERRRGGNYVKWAMENRKEPAGSRLGQDKAGQTKKAGWTAFLQASSIVGRMALERIRNYDSSFALASRGRNLFGC